MTWRPYQKRTETDLVRACLEHMRLKGILCWRQNAGALPKTYKGKTQYVTFGAKGMSDIVGIMPGGQVVCVECKMPGGKTTPHQERFLELVRQQGGRAMVAQSLDELERGLRGEGAG